MKDHEIAQFINELRDVAVEYGSTQQLRERIATVVKKYINEPRQTREDIAKWFGSPT